MVKPVRWKGHAIYLTGRLNGPSFVVILTIVFVGLQISEVHATPHTGVVNGPVGTRVTIIPTNNDNPILQGGAPLEIIQEILPPAVLPGGIGRVRFTLPNRLGDDLLEVTDRITRYESDDTRLAGLEETSAALTAAGGIVSFLPLGDFLATALGVGVDLVIPVLGTEAPLFTAVDLSPFQQNPPLFSIGDVFTVSGGTSPSLVGFLFSMVPVTFDQAIGFTTTAPFSGDVTVLAFQSLTAIPEVPEPSAFLLLASGLVGLAAWRWKNGVI